MSGPGRKNMNPVLSLKHLPFSRTLCLIKFSFRGIAWVAYSVRSAVMPGALVPPSPLSMVGDFFSIYIQVELEYNFVFTP